MKFVQIIEFETERIDEMRELAHETEQRLASWLTRRNNGWQAAAAAPHADSSSRTEACQTATSW